MNEEILKRLDLLASKLGVGAGEMWRILLKQSHIEGVEDSVVSIVALAIASVCIVVCVKYVNDLDEMGPLPVLVAGVALVIGVVFGYCAISELLNPEYYALHQIIAALK